MNKTRYLTQAAIIAALYAVLTHVQNLLLPGTTTWAIQMRISEAMTVLAFFTPAAIPGLSLGCLVFNLTYAGTLPLDFTGIDFALTALFVTIFVEQWLSTKNHLPALIGLVSAVVCLVLFGADNFLIPTMLLIAAILVMTRKSGKEAA